MSDGAGRLEAAIEQIGRLSEQQSADRRRIDVLEQQTHELEQRVDWLRKQMGLYPTGRSA